MPAPQGNMNAAKHGRRSNRRGMVIVHMARQYRSTEGNLHILRKALEAEARQSHGIDGDLPARLVSLISLAITYERVHQRAQRLAVDVAPEVAIEHEKTAAWAAQQRHVAIERLGLDSQTPAGLWATLDSDRASLAAGSELPPDHTSTTPDAIEATTEHVGGESDG